MHVTLWVVKGGRGGIREERFRARSVIGIGWGEVGDLSQYPDRDALRAAYRGSHPERREGHVNTQAAQLWAFGHRMQIGDPVVVPFLGQPVIAIGEITGPYRWAPSGDPDMPHTRNVTWLVTDLPRVAFDPDLRYSFGGSVTVCSVTRNHAESRVRAMIDDLQAPNPHAEGAWDGGYDRRLVTDHAPIDAYLARLPADQRNALEHLRATVARLVPDAVQLISYGMPAFKLHGRFLLSYAGWKRHCSIYPLTDAFLADHVDELAGFGRTKGSLHFTPAAPVPERLLEQLVLARVIDVRSETSGV